MELNEVVFAATVGGSFGSIIGFRFPKVAGFTLDGFFEPF